MPTLQFEFRPERYEDGSREEFWFAGIYKITKYEAVPSGPYARQAFYRGYFKPVGWKMWGEGVDHEQHATLTQAKAACRKHAATFPTPTQFDRI